MKIDIPAIFDFLIVTIIFKYIIVHWIAEKCMKAFKFMIVKTKSEAISWIHYSEGSSGNGHKSSTPYNCEDGYCKQLHDDK